MSDAPTIWHSDVERVFSEQRAAIKRGTYRLQRSDYDATEKVIEWARSEHGADPLAAIARSVAGFLAHATGFAGEANGYPYTSWSKDPARWYAATGGHKRGLAPAPKFDAATDEPEFFEGSFEEALAAAGGASRG